jgi:hypothetical protein
MRAAKTKVIILHNLLLSYNKIMVTAKTSPFLTIDQAIRTYGGHVRYFKSTEPLQDILALAARKANTILTCCGGGDQAITLLATIKGTGKLYAFDLNPAQLFVLAAKLISLSSGAPTPALPSWEELQQLYPGQLAPWPQDLRHIDRVYDTRKKCFKSLPDGFSRHFAFECDEGMHAARSTPPPFWMKNKQLLARIRSNIGRTRLLHADLFYVNNYFPKAYFDLIYISDISLIGPNDFYRKRIEGVLALLSRSGIIIGSQDQGEKYQASGETLITFLKNNRKTFGLDLIESKGNLLAMARR